MSCSSSACCSGSRSSGSATLTERTPTDPHPLALLAQGIEHGRVEALDPRRQDQALELDERERDAFELLEGSA
jgi:hypothetical protein